MNPQQDSFSYPPHPESFRDDNRTPTRFVMESGQFQMTPSLSTFVNPFEASFHDIVQHTDSEAVDASNGDVSSSSAPRVVHLSSVFGSEATVGGDGGIGLPTELQNAVNELRVREFDCTRSHKQSYGDAYHHHRSSPHLTHCNETEYRNPTPLQHDIAYQQDGALSILNRHLSSPPLSNDGSPEPSQQSYKDCQLTPPETPENTTQVSTMTVNIVDGDPTSSIVSAPQQVLLETDTVSPTIAQKQVGPPMLNVPTMLATTHPVEYYIDTPVNPFSIASINSGSTVPVSVPTQASDPPSQPSACATDGASAGNAAVQSDMSGSADVRDIPPHATDPQSDSRTAAPATSYSGRKRKTANIAAEESPEQKRQKFLEKNRLAAYKCRQNKKAWIKDLEVRRDKLQEENDRLQGLVRDLHQEWFDWRQKILGHHNCECNVIHQYVQRSAQNNFASFNNPCAYRSARSATSSSSSPSSPAEDGSHMRRYINDK